MKKFIYLLSFALMTSYGALQAQTKEKAIKKDVRYVINAGLAITNVDVTYSMKETSGQINTDPLNGFVIGALLEDTYRVGILDIGYTIGANFLQRGMTFLTDFDTEGTVKDLDIDIYPNFLFGVRLGGFRPFVNVGPYMTYNIDVNGKEKFLGRSKVEPTSGNPIYINIKDYYRQNRLGVGVMIGGGVEYSRFRVSANYAMGLSNRIRKDTDTQIDNKLSKYKWKQNTLLLTVGYVF